MDINHTTGGKRNKLWSNKAGCSTTGDSIILEFEIWKSGGAEHDYNEFTFTATRMRRKSSNKS